MQDVQYDGYLWGVPCVSRKEDESVLVVPFLFGESQGLCVSRAVPEQR